MSYYRGMQLVKKWLSILGPGVITGAADDDPSGVATYAMAGARFGYGMLWTALLTFPLMAAIQEMCARIGLVTQHGLSGTLRRHYAHVTWVKWALVMVSVLIFGANTLNIGADIAGMAAVSRLLVPGIPNIAWAVLYVVVISVIMTYSSYRTMAKIFKWLALVLFFYILSALLAHLPWSEVLLRTIWPKIVWNKEFLITLVAVLGTTISPYLFYWQASEEVEERKTKKMVVTKRELLTMREDVVLGMGFSNLAMWFIIACTAGTLWSHGITNIQTPDQAALALAPIAGKYSSVLFTLGIVGVGMLAIPILAGSAAYAVAEAFGWSEGLDKPWHKAKAFYLVFTTAMILGLLLTVSGIDPISMLFYTAVVLGVISPPLILTVMLIANNKKIMGDKVNGKVSNLLGGSVFLLMATAAVAMFVL